MQPIICGYEDIMVRHLTARCVNVKIRECTTGQQKIMGKEEETGVIG